MFTVDGSAVACLEKTRRAIRFVRRDFRSTINEFIATRSNRCDKRLLSKRFPSHDDRVVCGARKHAVAIARAVGGEFGRRDACREIKRATHIRHLLKRRAPTRAHRHERLIRAHPVGRHELVLHDFLRTENIALEPEFACACERTRGRRAIAIDRLSSPNRDFVDLNGAEFVAKDHSAEFAIADRQRFGPFRSGFVIPEFKWLGARGLG